MSLRPPRFERAGGNSSSQRLRGWLLPAALVALTPKCVLCVAAYFGAAAALGLSGPELCGGSTGSPHSWASWLAVVGVTGAIGITGFRPRGGVAA